MACIEAHLVARQSKNGNPYTALSIELAPHVEKLVFLTDAEMALYCMNHADEEVR